MLMLQPYVSTAILLLCLLWSKNVLAKAGMLLQEKERIQINKILANSLPMQVALSFLFFACMLFAGRYHGLPSGWWALAISAIFLLMYVLLNHRLYQRFLDSGFPNDFCRLFVLSRVVLVIGLLVFGHFLLGSALRFSQA